MECYGLEDFDTSMNALQHFTQYASSEFAIRSFIQQDEKRTMEQLALWAKQWLGKNENTDRLIKHSCRTLLKQGKRYALMLLGFTEPEHIKVSNFKVQNKVATGEKLAFSFILKCDEPLPAKNCIGKCRIELAIDFMKANGRQNRKVFKISEGKYTEKEKQVTKYFPFKEISTRKYYADEHKLTIN